MFDGILVFNPNFAERLAILINDFAPKIDWNIRGFNQFKYSPRVCPIRCSLWRHSRRGHRHSRRCDLGVDSASTLWRWFRHKRALRPKPQQADKSAAENQSSKQSLFRFFLPNKPAMTHDFFPIVSPLRIQIVELPTMELLTLTIIKWHASEINIPPTAGCNDPIHILRPQCVRMRFGCPGKKFVSISRKR